MFSDTVMGRLLFGWLVAIAASMLGIIWSFYSDYPTGPAVVVMLGLFLVLSSIVYYLLHAPVKARAAANVAGIAVFAFVFFFVLSYAKKSDPAVSTTARPPAVETLLEELKQGEEVHQLDAIAHLGGMHNPKIVPALTDLLSRAQSHQAVEATVEALAKQKDPRAIPALQRAARGPYDSFLKLSIAQAQVALGDREGLATLVSVLKSDGAALARQQASDLLEGVAGKKFGYQSDKDVRQNSAALARIDAWVNSEGKTVRLDAKARQFQAQK